MIIIVKQQNGLLCRYDTVKEKILYMNMTEEEYINLHIRETTGNMLQL